MKILNLIFTIILLTNCVNDKVDTNISNNKNLSSTHIKHSTKKNSMNNKNNQSNDSTIVVLQTSLGNIKIYLFPETQKHRQNFIKLVKEKFYDGILFHRVVNNFMIQAGDPNSKNASPGVSLGTGGPEYTIPAEFYKQYHHKKGAVAAARQSDQVNPEKKSSGSQFYIVHGEKYSKESLTIDIQLLQSYLSQYLNLPENHEFKNLFIQYQNEGRHEELNDLIFSKVPDIEKKLNISLRKEISPQRIKDYITIGGTPHLDDEYTVFGEVVEGIQIVDKIASTETDRNNRPLKDIIIKKAYIQN